MAKSCLILAGCLLVFCTGCVHHRPLLPSYDVPVACASEITMVRCDPASSPLRCEKIALTYKRGCERLKLR